ncbi:MAG: 30S ribosomal protein S15 [Proteobacteria bacterium]|nr:30S ribosomal protein S15 [Pseudomonadota bacterium]
MSLPKEEKEGIVKKFGKNERDTGSAVVQIALITARMNELQSHFETHKKDHHSRLGLLKLVGKRRSLLDYVKRENVQEYRTLIGELNIRK